MNIADNARNQAISLEAKKDKLVQLQSNDWKVTFTVQTIDMDPRLTRAAMGTRYAMVLVEIGDDELPVQKESRPAPRQEIQPQPAGDGRMSWREVQPAAQAGIRSNEPEFWAFLREIHGYPDVQDADKAAIAVRHICKVHSRSEFSTDHRKRVLWHQLDTQFDAWKMKERVGA